MIEFLIQSVIAPWQCPFRHSSPAVVRTPDEQRQKPKTKTQTGFGPSVAAEDDASARARAKSRCKSWHLRRLCPGSGWTFCCWGRTACGLQAKRSFRARTRWYRIRLEMGTAAAAGPPRLSPSLLLCCAHHRSCPSPIRAAARRRRSS